jgi:hypothetical protein
VNRLQKATDHASDPRRCGRSIGPDGESEAAWPRLTITRGPRRPPPLLVIVPTPAHCATIDFSSSDSGIRFNATRDNRNGTYAATPTSSTTPGTVRIIATDNSTGASGQAALTLATVASPVALGGAATAVTNLDRAGGRVEIFECGIRSAAKARRLTAPNREYDP